MVKADALKAEVVKANKEALGLPGAVLELNVRGDVVAAYQDGNLLSKADALKLASQISGKEGSRVTKTFKDYEGQSEYGDVVQYKF